MKRLLAAALVFAIAPIGARAQNETSTQAFSRQIEDWQAQAKRQASEGTVVITALARSAPATYLGVRNVNPGNRGEGRRIGSGGAMIQVGESDGWRVDNYGLHMGPSCGSATVDGPCRGGLQIGAADASDTILQRTSGTIDAPDAPMPMKLPPCDASTNCVNSIQWTVGKQQMLVQLFAGGCIIGPFKIFTIGGVENFSLTAGQDYPAGCSAGARK